MEFIGRDEHYPDPTVRFLNEALTYFNRITRQKCESDRFFF